MTQDAADLLENVCGRLVLRPQAEIVIDVLGVTYISEEGARVLRRLKTVPRVQFAGCSLFTEQVVEQAQAL